jgi:hypothetical protein
MKKQFAFLKYLTFIIIILNGCSKDDITIVNENQAAINEIKKIVGDNGKISVYNNFKTEDNYFILNTSPTNFDTSHSMNLNLKQFKIIYVALNSGKLWGITNENENSNSFNVVQSFDGDSIQRTGYHLIRFSPAMPSIGYFGPNSSFISYLNLQYYTDNKGFVIGSPSISFSGITLFNWNQNFLSPIQTQLNNKLNTGSSIFTIGGNARFGIGNFNWESHMSYTITIDIDGTVSVTSGVGGLK